jgi:hypothetical protein
MRILSAPLLAAQKSPSAVPYLKVVVSDRIGGVRRLAYSRIYSGSEPDGYHAAAMPGDGSLLRARVSGGRLHYQRVTAPGAGSNFSAWTDLSAAANAGVALCAAGSRALLFYADSGGTVLKVRESTDNGATLGAPATVATATGAVTWLAADVKANGDALLLYSVGATVYSVKRTSGAWGAPAAWTNGVGSVSGLACYHQGDWNVVITGADASGVAFGWSCIFGDGSSQASGTWSALREITRGSSGSSVSFQAPFLSQPDTYRLTFVEKYAGTAGYSRPCHSYAPASADYAFNLWREPVPFDLASDYGQAITFSSAAVWLSTPSGVWTASITPASLTVSADVIEAATYDLPFDGRARILLRNDDGRYSSLPAPLRPGAEVRVSPGYVTSTGEQVSDGPVYWIESVERRSGGGEALVALEARDAWGILGAWRARRQYAWAAGEKNAFGILQFLFARAGLEFFSVSGSVASVSLRPAFTVSPGESALTAVRRLLQALPDLVFVRGNSALLVEPLASQAAGYAYGTDHALLSGRYLDRLPTANRVQVFGRGVFGEGFDWPGIELVYDHLEQVHDMNVASATDAENRAAYVLRHQAIAALAGEIAVPVSCGQELYDVIEVTDAGAGLSAAKRRVLGLSLRYSTGARPAYEHRIALGGV